METQLHSVPATSQPFVHWRQTQFTNNWVNTLKSLNNFIICSCFGLVAHSNTWNPAPLTQITELLSFMSQISEQLSFAVMFLVELPVPIFGMRLFWVALQLPNRLLLPFPFLHPCYVVYVPESLTWLRYQLIPLRDDTWTKCRSMTTVVHFRFDSIWFDSQVIRHFLYIDLYFFNLHSHDCRPFSLVPSWNPIKVPP